MSAHWHIGMEVECIDDRNFEPFIREGQKYTIVGIGNVEHGWYAGCYGRFAVLELAEARNPQDAKFPKLPRGFAALRFRPIQTRKTSIEIFNRILLNPSIRISEEV